MPALLASVLSLQLSAGSFASRQNLEQRRTKTDRQTYKHRRIQIGRWTDYGKVKDFRVSAAGSLASRQKRTTSVQLIGADGCLDCL